MGKYKDLLLNTGLFAFSQFATKIITFLLVPLYTYYMATDEFGVTDLATTTITLLIPMATLSISDAMMRFVIDDADERDSYISIGFVIVALGILVVMLLSPLFDLGFFGGLGRYRWLFIGNYVASSVYFYFGFVTKALNQVKLIPISAIATTLVTSLGAYVFIAVLHHGVPGYFYSQILGLSVGIAMYMIVGKQYRHLTRVSWKTGLSLLRRMLIYSVPLLPNGISWWISTSINRFIITGMIGVGASGMFAAAGKIPNLLNMICSIFQQAWQLSAFQEAKKKSTVHFFSVIYKIYHAGMAISSSVIIVIAPLLASFMLQKQFYQAWLMIPFLILAFYFSTLSTFYGTIFTSAMKTRPLMTTTLMGAIAVIVFTAGFIPLFGLQGAAIAMCLSNALVFALRVHSSRSIIAIDINWPAFLLTLVLLCGQALVMVSQSDGYMVWSAGLCGVVIVVQVVDTLPLIRRLFTQIRSRS